VYDFRRSPRWQLDGGSEHLALKDSDDDYSSCPPPDKT
jgi:hypothetical protein